MSLLEEAEDETHTFESLGIAPQILATIKKLGYKAPTKIQSEAIPVALKGSDIIGLAQTGSGKTAAYAIPIIQAFMEKPQGLFACVVAPTRELGYQISEQFEALGASVGLKSVVIVGGMDHMTQAIALAKKPHVVIGTPGRLVFHLEQTKGFSLHTVKYLVLDEADRLLNMDFEEEITKLLRVLPKERKTYLYSATMTQKVAKLQRVCLMNPVKLEITSKYQTVDTLVQQYLFIPHKYKECYLVMVLNDFAGNTTIIFTATCAASARITLTLRHLGYKAVPINGDMSQDKRLVALNKFKAGERNILVATDVAARGLDIPAVDLVINFDVPQSSKDYIHRVGRTARAGRAGRAVTIVTQYDVELYQKIEELIKLKLEAYPTQEDVALAQLERVNEAERLAAVKMRELGAPEVARNLAKLPNTEGAEDSEDVNFLAVKKRKNNNGNNNGNGNNHNNNRASAKRGKKK